MILDAGLVLVLSFLGLLVIGAPIGICIAASSAITILLELPADIAIFTTAQKMASSLDSFTLLAVPFFIFSGVLMNNGGIALRLVNFAKLFSARIPGSLAHTNIVGNMMFGAISGSAIAASTSIGGVMVPMSEKEGYSRPFSASANIASAPTGMLIPPTTSFILYALASGGTSISALFAGGLVAGSLWGAGCILVALIIAKYRNYTVKLDLRDNSIKTVIFQALPSLLLIAIIVGGIVFGIFTAVEASAIAVIYTIFLTVIVYRTINLSSFIDSLIKATETTGVIMFLLAASSAMSFAMSITGLPTAISSAILGFSDNPATVLLIITALLLIIGCFMDIGPAILIFTPILLPITSAIDIDPIHFGIIMVFNLCIGTITPPVGTGLFIGAGIAKEKVENLLIPLLPFYFVILSVLLLITFIPEITLFLPVMMGL
ncbi:TRAP transporter large permease [Halomonas elongata]|uniref:TRAP transporter large permease protein n=2 Tax=Halomonas elongata TaxID=2746 RepID=E1V418_HALED|nr:TRAP transporter large permease [Halomonas elongata]WBF16592.1 TRAP transporter large permease [Halomonas elongata]WPU49033.1 TRAP transporter large permease [Halomonas elongata DSM 2581]WVI70267.1 TRAP transporter large permease [Halomonas elongata]CBV42847.1 TRAP transporter large transmembrane protein [Halomonas elongata DSM 2581]